MKRDSSPVIQTIAALGALWTDVCGFFDQDMAYLFHASELCSKMGFTFKLPLNIYPLNLAYGDDALNKRVCYPADLVVSCLVNNFKRADREIAGTGQRNLESAHHRDPRAWYRFAARTNAKAIAIVSDSIHCDELTASDFAGRRFVRGPETIFTEDLSLGLAPPERYTLRLETLVRRDVAKSLGL